MIEEARHARAGPGLASLTLEVGDAEALPCPDGGFDAAFSLLVLPHVYGPDGAVREIARVLRPGGVYLAAEYHRSETRPSTTPSLILLGERRRPRRRRWNGSA